MDRRISNKIKFISFLYSIGVVFFHVNPIPEEQLWCNNPLVEWVCARIYHFCSNLGTYANIFFILLSAFLLYYNLDKSNYVTKLKSRIYSLVIPIILWNIIYVVPFVVIRGEKFVIGDVFFSRYCVPMWFMVALVVYLLLSPILMLLMRNKIVAMMIGALLLIFRDGIAEAVSRYIADWTYCSELVRIISFFPVYYLGIILAVFFKDMVLEEKYQKNIVVRLIIYVGIVLPLITDICGINHFILELIHVIAVWCLVKGDYFDKKLPKYMGDSFGIYAIHTGLLIVVVTIFIKLGFVFEEMSIFFPLYLLVRTIFVGLFVVISLAFTGVFRKILPKLYGVLYGKRNMR